MSLQTLYIPIETADEQARVFVQACLTTDMAIAGVQWKADSEWHASYGVAGVGEDQDEALRDLRARLACIDTAVINYSDAHDEHSPLANVPMDMEIERRIAHRLSIGDPRSAAYHAGLRIGAYNAAGLIHDNSQARCPHPLGTAQADAWVMGACAGADLVAPNQPAGLPS